MTLDLSPKDKQAHTRMLARHLPDGKVWENKFNSDSNIGKLIVGLACEYLRLSYIIDNFLTEMDINQTNDLIKEWQVSVGIPTDCIGVGGTLEEQRRNILLQINNYNGIQTAQSFVDLAALFGFSAVVTNGVHNGTFPLAFPIRFFDNRKAAVHTILVDLEESRFVFPLAFPLPFSSGVTGLIECLFNKLKPANCQILYRYGIIDDVIPDNAVTHLGEYVTHLGEYVTYTP